MKIRFGHCSFSTHGNAPGDERLKTLDDYLKPTGSQNS
jgi:hypothetical protein